MKVFHKIARALLLILLLSAFSAVTVSAAYSDVTDAETAEALGVLDAFGLVSGYPDGSYRPNETLTRAQFCKFAVLIMDLEDQLLSASQRTLFSDVTSEHWAASYVNLAYSKALIQGYGNGTFGPDDSITYEQAVTISLRILGYENSEIGTYYPDDQLRFAKKLGLTDSLNRSAGDVLTRGEAAKLLYSLLRTTAKKGGMYAAALADRSVNSVILLDEHTASPTGLLNCARFYSSGQAVWYPLGTTLDTAWIGAEGTALLDSDGVLIAFLPSKTSYTVVDGILLSAGYRNKNASGSSGYSVKLHTDSGVKIYPRANSISTNLVGSSGTLILNESSYATAFISDDSTVYNLTDEAILLSTNATSDIGITGCAEFSVNGKTVWFRQSLNNRLSNALIGTSGTVMYDDTDTLVDFLTDGTRYDVLTGIYIKTESGSASFIVNEEIISYPTAGSIGSVQAGTYGTIMLNEQNYIVSFTADSSKKYSVVTDALLLSSHASTGYSYGAKFYVNGKTTVYPYSSSCTNLGSQQGKLDMSLWYQYLYSQNLSGSGTAYLAASSAATHGIILLDSEGCIVQFITDGTAYRMLTGILISANTSDNLFGTYVTFHINGQTMSFPQNNSISGTAGSYGTLLLTPAGYAIDFIPDSTTGYSASASGILLSVNEIADDGLTVLAKLYTNGQVKTYAVSGVLSASYIGQNGKLMLDSAGRAIDFIVEAGKAQQTAVYFKTGSTATCIKTNVRDYTVDSKLSVIWNGTSTSWEKVCNDLPDGTFLTLQFNELGSLILIIIG